MRIGGTIVLRKKVNHITVKQFIQSKLEWRVTDQ